MRRLRQTLLLTALTCAGLAAMPAQAIELIATGQLAPTLRDLSGRSALLENGVPGDLLGGIGSGLAWAGGNTFLALPDRGPNANAWNGDVDDTVSYVPRFHTLQLDLIPRPGAALPYRLETSLLATTLFSSHTPLNYGGSIAGYAAEPAGNTPSRQYFSGRSDNFDPTTSSADTRDARLDPEGIRLSPNGRMVYISDEYGPYLYVFDRATGARLHAIKLPEKLAVAHKSAQGSIEKSTNTSGRVANKGMEGLAISPDGKTLFGFMQSPLLQDGGDGGRMNRIVKIDLATGTTTEYTYDNYLADKDKTYNSSELLALNDHELLVLERDGKGLGDDSKAKLKRIYKVDIAGAADVSELSGEAVLLAKAPAKTLFLDILATLAAAGYADTEVPAKLEGMAFGEDVVVNGKTMHTLYVANDNDYLAESPENHLANPNQCFVFAFDDADLGGSKFENQHFTGR